MMLSFLSPDRREAVAAARVEALRELEGGAPFEKETLSLFEAKKPAWGGRTAAVFAPSYQMLSDAGRIDDLRRERAAAHLAAASVQVRFEPNAYRQEGRYAGSDAERAEGFTAALCGGEADLALALRGGYGAARLLPLLDWRCLERADRTFAGYSDVTALNLAFLAKLGRSSWQAPMMGDLSEAHADMAFVLEHFGALLGEAARPVVFDTADLPLDPGLPASPQISGEALLGPVGDSKEAFSAEGMLWGGNLCLVESLVGTPYFPQIEGGILFLEDVGEAAYRVERMLLTLLDAGVLSRQKAVLLGDFAGAERAWRFPGDHSLARAFLTIRERFDREGLSIPLVTGLPFGHIPRKVSLPVGVRARLVLEPAERGRRAVLSWTQTVR